MEKLLFHLFKSGEQSFSLPSLFKLAMRYAASGSPSIKNRPFRPIRYVLSFTFLTSSFAR